VNNFSLFDFSWMNGKQTRANTYNGTARTGKLQGLMQQFGQTPGFSKQISAPSVGDERVNDWELKSRTTSGHSHELVPSDLDQAVQEAPTQQNAHKHFKCTKYEFHHE
jgi:hypothetical protein